MEIIEPARSKKIRLTPEEKVERAAAKQAERDEKKKLKEIERKQNKVDRLKERLTEKYNEDTGNRVSTQLAGTLGLVEKSDYRLYGDGQPNGVMVIVDYPTTKEDRVHEICYGTPRRLVDKTINQYYKGNIYWTSAVKVGFDKKSVELGVWKPYIEDLEQEIEYVQPKKILVLGGVALATLIKSQKGVSMANFHGRGYTLKFSYGECYMIPSYNPYSVIEDDALGRDLLRDIYKLFNSQDTVQVEPSKLYSSPMSEPTFIAALNKLNSYPEVSCDIETTSLNAFNGTIESIGFGTIDSYNLIVNHHMLKLDYVKKHLTNFFDRCKCRLVFHNAKFDMKWIEIYTGKIIGAGVEDTLLMNYMLDERPIGGKYAAQSLKDLSRMYFDATDYHFDFKKWNATPEDERDYISFWQYQCLDLQYTIRLYYKLLHDLGEVEPRTYKTYKSLILPTLRMFTDAEKYGFLVDKEYLQKLHDEYNIKHSAIVKNIRELLPEKYANLNPLSPEQLHTLLAEEMDIEAGARRKNNQGKKNEGTGKDEMKQYILRLEIKARIAKTHEEVVKIYNHISILKEVMKLRQVAKLNSTYFKGLINKIDYDGKVRSDIRIAGTTTGRLSSSEPNLQNIPSRLKIDNVDFNELVKNAFIVKKDCVLLEVDYAQLELRMASYLSKDNIMAELFRQGIDMHRVVAGKMFHKEPANITKFERYMAKAVGFGILYGRGAAALVDGVEMDEYVNMGGTRATVEEMQQFIDDFLNQFPVLQQWIKDVQDSVMKVQYVQTIFGRKRRFNLILPDVYKKNEIKRQAVNTLIQSAASDLCLSAAVQIDKIIKTKFIDKAHFLLSVHDSIMVEADADVADEVRLMMEWVMSKGVINTAFVPFDVEAKVGKSWGSTKELK